jgi:Restriction endonuclease
LSGPLFELYMERVFKARGYRVKNTSGPGDQGCDLLLKRKGEIIVCQLKRYSNSVSNSAVQQAVTAVRIYHAHRAMVVTTADFTKSARDAAKSNDCELIGREDLGRWIAEFRKRGQRGQPGARLAQGLLVASLTIANLIIGHDLGTLQARPVPPRAEPKPPVAYPEGERTPVHHNDTPVASGPVPAEIDNHVRIQPSDSLFEVIEDSPVFESASDSSAVLARVHMDRTLHVIGVAGAFLQVRMKNGTTGFVPNAVASYKSAWLEPGDD